MSPLLITNNLLLNEQGRACSIRPKPIRLFSLAAGLLLIGWMEAYADLPPGDPLDLERLQAKDETNRRLKEENRQLEQQQAEAKHQAEEAKEKARRADKENAELRQKVEAAERELVLLQEKKEQPKTDPAEEQQTRQLEKENAAMQRKADEAEAEKQRLQKRLAEEKRKTEHAEAEQRRLEAKLEQSSGTGNTFHTEASTLSGITTSSVTTANAAASAAVGSTIKDCNDCPELVVIPSGEFTMGSPNSEKDRGTDEGLQHTVKIGYTLAVGKYEVTRGEFAHFVAEKNYKTDAERGGGCYTWKHNAWVQETAFKWSNLGFEQDDRHPVACVSWNDAQAYIQWLNGKSGQRFRLLSEAEWEYAARGGKGNRRFPWGDDSAYTELCRYANGVDETAKTVFSGYTAASCSDGYVYTSPAGSRTATPFGLYDLHGNVWEWVEDCYKDSYSGAPNDGSAVQDEGCSQRVLRGGSWFYSPRHLRSADRVRYTPVSRDYSGGFRLARMLP